MATDSISAADIVLPSQFYQAAGSRSLTSEQRLMLAILADAINIFQGWRRAASARRRHLYEETEQWIFGSPQGGTISFDDACDALEINSQSLRKRLAEFVKRGLNTASLEPVRLRLKESARAQHVTLNRPRHRRRRGRPVILKKAS